MRDTMGKRVGIKWSYRATAIVAVLCVAVIALLIVRELIRQGSRRTTIDFFRERGGRITVEEQKSPWYMLLVGQRTHETEVGAFLHDTSVTNSDLQHLRALAELRVVYLDHTDISDDGVAHVAALQKVTRLDLESTEITDEALEFLEQMSSLKSLSLNDTKITDKALKYCARLHSLEELSLFGTAVTLPAIDDLQRARPQLHIVWSRPPPMAHRRAQSAMEKLGAVFHRAQVRGQLGSEVYIVSLRRDVPEEERWIGTLDDLDHLRHIQGLEAVSLRGDGFGNEALERLSRISGLQGVIIEDCTVTDDGLRHLESLNSLKGVGVTGTSVTDAGVAAFKQARPDVQVTKREW